MAFVINLVDSILYYRNAKLSAHGVFLASGLWEQVRNWDND